jgi:hypothetical protein
MSLPAQPKIYRITLLDRIPSILKDGSLCCDRRIIQRQGVGTVIGMGGIKQRRLMLPVGCHPGTCVGDQARALEITCHSTFVHDRSCSS